MTTKAQDIKVTTTNQVFDAGQASAFDEDKKDEIVHLKRCNIVVFMTLMILGAWHVGYSIASANQVATLLNVKYGWTEEQQPLNQSLIGSSVIVGLCVGSLVGGKVIAIGRRNTQLAMNLLGCFGVSMTLIQSFPLLLIGRLIYGIAVGVESVCMPRYVEEYLPLRRYGLCIALYAGSINIGSTMAILSAVILPSDTDTEALLADEVDWRIIFGLPLVPFTLSTIGFLVQIRYDGPSFYLGNAVIQGGAGIQKESKSFRLAQESVQSIYKTNGDDSYFESLVQEIEKSSKLTGSTKVSLKEAMWTDENYMRASWVNVANMFFHEVAGINVILQYSNTILDTILGDSSSGFNARTGSYMISLTNLSAAIVSVWTINNFGRRTLLLLGHSGMTIIHTLIGLFIMIQFNVGVLVGICTFLVIYQNSSGPIAYQYAAETCCDIGLGMNILALYLSILILSLSTEPLMNSWLQPQGVFFLFAILSACAVVFLYFYLGETMGLERAEKKGLYVPGGAWGRKLKPDEVPYSPFIVRKQPDTGKKYQVLNATDETNATCTSSPKRF